MEFPPRRGSRWINLRWPRWWRFYFHNMWFKVNRGNAAITTWTPRRTSLSRTVLTLRHEIALNTAGLPIENHAYRLNLWTYIAYLVENQDLFFFFFEKILFISLKNRRVFSTTAKRTNGFLNKQLCLFNIWLTLRVEICGGSRKVTVSSLWCSLFRFFRAISRRRYNAVILYRRRAGTIIRRNAGRRARVVGIMFARIAHPVSINSAFISIIVGELNARAVLLHKGRRGIKSDFSVHYLNWTVAATWRANGWQAVSHCPEYSNRTNNWLSLYAPAWKIRLLDLHARTRVITCGDCDNALSILHATGFVRGDEPQMPTKICGYQLHAYTLTHIRRYVPARVKAFEHNITLNIGSTVLLMIEVCRKISCTKVGYISLMV